MAELIGAVVLVGAMVALEALLLGKARQAWDRRAVVRWLTANTRDEPGESHVGTFELAQALRLPEDRVREACKSSPGVFRAAGEREEWSVWRKERDSTFGKREATTI